MAEDRRRGQRGRQLVAPIHMEYPADLSPTHFIRLQLTRGSELISENFYWRGTQEDNFRALRELPRVKVQATTHALKDRTDGC